MDSLRIPILKIGDILIASIQTELHDASAVQFKDDLLQQIYTTRAQAVIVDRQQADVVIMDITGVPVVDTGVGNHLLQAAQAAELLGARVILVGISAEVAQTMVQLGINLSRIVTLATLQAGIEHALDLQGLAIARRQTRATTQ